MENFKKPVQRYYKPELDVLRFFAFLFVFFVHRLDLAPIDGKEYYWAFHLSLIGNYGVPLFFFLSAFLITELLIREQDSFGHVDVKSFYIRRILRIWPLYFTFFYLMVVLTWTTPIFSSPIPSGTQIAFTFFSGNWNITFNKWQSYCINPLWSVSVEEQLYIILPLIVYYGGKRGLKIFSFVVLVISYLSIIYYALNPTSGFSGQWTNSFVQFQFFAAGILCSVYLGGKQPQWDVTTRMMLFVVGVVCWLIASIICEINADAPHLATISQSVSGWILILAGVMLMFFSLLGIAPRYLPNPFIYLGRISYGMYIMHITIYWITYQIFKDDLAMISEKMGLLNWKNEVGFVLAFMITVLFATLSYNFFEKPFLKLKNRFTLMPSREV
jgi:peptidoglycan/LPS O-acetylase OafA/YrhL